MDKNIKTVQTTIEIALKQYTAIHKQINLESESAVKHIAEYLACVLIASQPK